MYKLERVNGKLTIYKIHKIPFTNRTFKTVKFSDRSDKLVRIDWDKIPNHKKIKR